MRYAPDGDRRRVCDFMTGPDAHPITARPAAMPSQSGRRFAIARVPRLPRWLRQPRHGGGACWRRNILGSAPRPKKSWVALLAVGGGPGALRLGEADEHALGDLAEGATLRVRRLRGDDRQTAIARLSHRAHEGDLPEERDPGGARHLRAAAVPEEVRARAASRADVEAHVLDHAEDRRVHLLEHRDAATHVGERDVLWRRHDDAAGERDLLRDRQLDVPRPGRQVEDQDVELAPLDVPQELRDELRHHRAAPDDGRRLPEEHPHRDDAETVLLHRDYPPILG